MHWYHLVHVAQMDQVISINEGYLRVKGLSSLLKTEMLTPQNVGFFSHSYELICRPAAWYARCLCTIITSSTSDSVRLCAYKSFLYFRPGDGQTIAFRRRLVWFCVHAGTDRALGLRTIPLSCSFAPLAFKNASVWTRLRTRTLRHTVVHVPVLEWEIRCGWRASLKIYLGEMFLIVRLTKTLTHINSASRVYWPSDVLSLNSFNHSIVNYIMLINSLQ